MLMTRESVMPSGMQAFIQEEKARRERIRAMLATPRLDAMRAEHKARQAADKARFESLLPRLK